MARKITNLEIDEVSLVDSPANASAKVLIFKRQTDKETIMKDKLPEQIADDLRGVLDQLQLEDVELPADLRKRFGELASAPSDRVTKMLEGIDDGGTVSKDEIWDAVTSLAKSLRQPGETEAESVSRACDSEAGRRLYSAYCNAPQDPRPAVAKSAELDGDMPEWDAIMRAATSVISKSGKPISTAQAIAEAVRENPALYSDYLAAKER
jgi:hypothetical protein